jgi:hypothetical protein
VRRLRSKDIVSVKVLWKRPSGEEITWEPEEVMRKSTHIYLKIKVSSMYVIIKKKKKNSRTNFLKGGRMKHTVLVIGKKKN